MAEITLAELRELTRGAASASRVLALPSVARGGAPLPVYPASDAVEKLFGQRNSLIVAESEHELLTFWSITGLLSSVLTVGRTAAQWLERSGISKHRAEAYARILFSEVHGLTESGFDEGLEHVSTPGGLNVMMRERLQRAGMEQQLSEGLDDINQRLLKNIDNSNAAAFSGAQPSSPEGSGTD
jgi:pyrroline-5-carboxylate reductase